VICGRFWDDVQCGETGKRMTRINRSVELPEQRQIDHLLDVVGAKLVSAPSEEHARYGRSRT